jgi:transposase
MVDRTKLKEALKVPARPVTERGLEGLYALPLEVIDLRTAAARAVAEAPEIWWCDEHAHPAAPEVEDALAYSMNRIKPCRMVRKFLVPAEEETR